MFGKNEFRVEVFYDAGSITAPAGCDFQYTTPYEVADSVISRFVENKNDSLYVFYFGRSLATAMNRISVEFKSDPVQIIAGDESATEAQAGFFRRCALLMKSDTSVALVDYKNRIRGYYDGRDRDDVDRLIVEMKVILRKY